MERWPVFYTKTTVYPALNMRAKWTHMASSFAASISSRTPLRAAFARMQAIMMQPTAFWRTFVSIPGRSASDAYVCSHFASRVHLHILVEWVTGSHCTDWTRSKYFTSARTGHKQTHTSVYMAIGPPILQCELCGTLVRFGEARTSPGMQLAHWPTLATLVSCKQSKRYLWQRAL